MMTRPLGPTSATESIDWREARYLTRVVQMLVTSRVDKAEFKRELDNLANAARALRARIPVRPAEPVRELRPDPDEEAERVAEGAVLALWRTHAATADRDIEGANSETAVDAPHVAPPSIAPVDEAELARAIEEIERAAAALRDEEPAAVARAVEEIERAAAALREDAPGIVAPVQAEAVPARRSWWVWLQIAGLWTSIVLASAVLILGLLVLTR
jgi:hypothetical protein